jgi:hypothetical protein
MKCHERAPWILLGEQLTGGYTVGDSRKISGGERERQEQVLVCHALSK